MLFRSALASASRLASVPEALERCDFRTAAEAILSLAGEANGYLNEQAPWVRRKQPEQGAAVAADLYAVLETSRLVAVLLAPLLPDLSARMLGQLGQPPLLSGPQEVTPGAWQAACRWGGLTPGHPLPEPSPVMQRLELDGPL